MSDHPLPGQLSLFSTEELHRPDPNRLADVLAFAKNCRRCGLRSGCTQVVTGEGNTDRPPVAFMGEAPGEQEDLHGHPFMGPVGALLDKMMEAIELTRSKVWLGYVTACRPPGSRQPTKMEVGACRDWWVGQLRAVQPKVIVALGSIAANSFLETTQEGPVASFRKDWYNWQGIPLRVIYHPSYLLRNPAEKTEAWRDLQEVQKKLRVLGAVV